MLKPYSLYQYSHAGGDGCRLTSLPGISFKTQALYATVFITRYLDLLYEWVSLYNFTMKVFFIASSCYILYLMKMRYR